MSAVSNSLTIYNKFLETLKSGNLDNDKVNRAGVTYIMIDNCFRRGYEQFAKTIFDTSIEKEVWSIEGVETIDGVNKINKFSHIVFGMFEMKDMKKL